MIKAYKPAPMSSSTMPAPCGTRSSWRTGGGLRMSKARKSRNAASKDVHVTARQLRESIAPRLHQSPQMTGLFFPRPARRGWKRGFPQAPPIGKAPLPSTVANEEKSSGSPRSTQELLQRTPSFPAPASIFQYRKKLRSAWPSAVRGGLRLELVWRRLPR